MLKANKILNKTRKQIYKNLSNEQLALLYQKESDDAIISEIYYKNFPVLMLYYRKYQQLNKDDKTSIILFGIYKTLNAYDNSKNIKFITLLTHLIKTDMNMEVRAINSKKRLANKNSISLNKKIEMDGKLQEIGDFIEDRTQNMDDVLLKVFLRKTPLLTPRQKEICNILIKDGYRTNREIREILNLTKSEVRYDTDKIKSVIKSIF